MPTRDPASSSQVLPLLNPDAYAATATSTTPVIDTLGFRYATVVMNFGTLAGAVTTAAMQSSATSGGAYANITDAAFVIVGDEDDGLQIGQIDTHQTGRFLRLNYLNGASANDMGAIIILSNSADTSAYAATATIFSV